MSRQAPRGLTPPQHQASRENTDERESYLTYSTTPVGKRKQQLQDEEDNDDDDAMELPRYPHNDNHYSHGGDGSASMGATTLGPLTAPAIIVAESESGPSSPLSPTSSSGLHHEQAKISGEPAYSKWSTIGHQICFLATGIFSTIAVQWLNYQGAASGTTMLTVFFNYIGMMSVGLVYALQSWYADRSQRRQAMTSKAAGADVEYDVLMSELHDNDDEDDGQGVKNHVEFVGKKIGNHSRGNSKQTAAMDMDQGHEVDHDDDSDDEIDVEKQRLRMKTSTMTATAKGKMRREDRSAGLPESDTEPQQGRAGLHWPVIQVAVMDVVANALVTIGFFYVGSGMYQVIYSSIVIWCAILTRIFLARKLNNVQWLAIVGVTIGLAISAVGTVQDVSPDDGPVQTWLEKSFGALITLGATFLYACVYVLSDKVLSTFKPKPIPEKVCSMVGGYASLLTFVYLCVYTFPKWQTEVVDVVHAHHGSWVSIVLVYPLVTISSMLHSLNYYVLISRINSVAVGIMQSLRAVLVFVMSHYLFCSISTTQCFNEWKFVSAIVVIGCVTLFSISSAPAAPESKESIELHATG
ncbi:hypothetical protein B0O80DRAFT_435745 [Mortierella sp. GBAus27b]|nr:hypothetical protein B0O80DRAFT_435745 [Mortierella sp. GBAus27b]